MKEKFMLQIARDPKFRMDDIYDLSKAQLRERTMEKIGEMRHYVKTDDAKTFARRVQVGDEQKRRKTRVADEQWRWE